MSKFKVGDRVRIVCPKSIHCGWEGTVWDISYNVIFAHGGRANIGFNVDVDGYGRYDHKSAYPICYEAHDLEPVVNPDELAWIAFRDLHLKPDPALILAKEAA